VSVSSFAERIMKIIKAYFSTHDINNNNNGPNLPANKKFKKLANKLNGYSFLLKNKKIKKKRLDIKKEIIAKEIEGYSKERQIMTEKIKDLETISERNLKSFDSNLIVKIILVFVSGLIIAGSVVSKNLIKLK
jgi:hypothetical protein